MAPSRVLDSEAFTGNANALRLSQVLNAISVLFVTQETSDVAAVAVKLVPPGVQIFEAVEEDNRLIPPPDQAHLHVTRNSGGGGGGAW